MSEIIAIKEPAIYKAIQEGLERVNARATSNAQKIQKWVILERDFSISGGELGEFCGVLFCFLEQKPTPKKNEESLFTVLVSLLSF